MAHGCQRLGWRAGRGGGGWLLAPFAVVGPIAGSMIGGVFGRKAGEWLYDSVTAPRSPVPRARAFACAALLSAGAWYAWPTRMMLSPLPAALDHRFAPRELLRRGAMGIVFTALDPPAASPTSGSGRAATA